MDYKSNRQVCQLAVTFASVLFFSHGYYCFNYTSVFLQLTYLKTQLTASPVDFKNRLCYTMVREKKL